MTTTTTSVKYVDWVAVQGPVSEADETHNGELLHYNTSECVEWRVDGKTKFSMTWSEFEAMLKCVRLGEHDAG